MDALETLLRGLATAGMLFVPGLLLVRAAWPSLDRGLLVLAGLATGLAVVPTLAFGVALLVGSNLRWPILSATAVLVTAVALAWSKLGGRESSPTGPVNGGSSHD